MSKINNVFGPRVVVQVVSEKYDGLIMMPPNSTRNNHIIGKVLYVGDGIVGGKQVFTPELEVGDIVMFQTNDYMLQNALFKFNGENCLNLHQGDMVAKLKSTKVTLANFIPIGRWALIEQYTVRKSLIVLPENAEMSDEDNTYFRVVARGTQSAIDIKSGDTVMIDRNRINVLSIDGKNYFYLDEAFILGVYTP